MADDSASPLRAETAPPVRSSSGAVPVSVSGPDTVTRLPVVVTSAPVLRSRLPPTVLGLVELTRKPVPPPRFSAPPDRLVSGAAAGAVSVAPLETSTKVAPVSVNVVAEASSSGPASVAADPVPVTTKSWSPLPTLTVAPEKPSSAPAPALVRRAPPETLKRSSVVARVPPVRASAGPFRVSRPFAVETRTPLRAATAPPLRSSNGAVPVSVSVPETLTRSPVVVTPVLMVRSRLPAIWLAPVELMAKPVAVPRASEPPDSAVRGPGPVAVRTAPVETSTRDEPVREKAVFEASSRPAASVADDPAPVSWKSWSPVPLPALTVVFVKRSSASAPPATSRPPAETFRRSSVVSSVLPAPDRSRNAPPSVSTPVADDTTPRFRARTSPPASERSGVAPVLVSGPDTLRRLPGAAIPALIAVPLVASRPLPRVDAVAELNRKPVAAPFSTSAPPVKFTRRSPVTLSAAPVITSIREVPVRLTVEPVASRSAPPRVSREPVPASSSRRSPVPLPTPSVAPERLRSGPLAGPTRRPPPLTRMRSSVVLAPPPTASRSGLPDSVRVPVWTAASVREASVLDCSAMKGLAAPAVRVPVTSTTSLVTVTALPVALARAEASVLVVAAGTLRRSPVTVAVWLVQLWIGGGGVTGGVGGVSAGPLAAIDGVTGTCVGLCMPVAAWGAAASAIASISTWSPPAPSPLIRRASSTAFACSWATISAGALGSDTRRLR